MIQFKTISWKNFLSTGNSPTEIDLCKNKLTMIVGENGNGKSTLLDAICYALYNKAFRNINKPQLGHFKKSGVKISIVVFGDVCLIALIH